jgi:hypothetical protein
MTQQNLSDEQAVQAVYGYAANLMKDGASELQIESKLMEKGLDQQSASIVVRNLARLRSNAVKDAGKKNMLFGALWCIGGLVVTAVTYSAASGGGTYIVAWGAIIFGAIQFFRGVFQYLS